MEPRWRSLYGDRFLYIGGTAKFDIWYVPHENSTDVESIRVVWDHSTWEAYYVRADRQLGGATWNEPNRPTEAEMVEIEQYLILFAPNLNIVPSYTGHITEGDTDNVQTVEETDGHPESG